MTKRGLFLIVVALVLAVLYAVYFTGWFDRRQITIVPILRPTRMARDGSSVDTYPVAFKFDGRYRFTNIKVVSEQDLATNKYPRSLWHLVSDTHSSPIDSFGYGERIRRMKPAVPAAVAEPLEPNVSYVLLIEADSGRYTGRTNFMTRAVSR